MSAAINTRLVGKTVRHPDLGTCIVTATAPGSRTLVELRCIQRGKGWDPIRERYRTYAESRPNPDAGEGAMTIVRRLTRQDQYGHEDQAHVSELKLE